MYLFLPLKGHFDFSGFRCLTFLLEQFDPKKRVASALRLAENQKKTLRTRTDADGHQNLNGSHTKALRAIKFCCPSQPLREDIFFACQTLCLEAAILSRSFETLNSEWCLCLD